MRAGAPKAAWTAIELQPAALSHRPSLLGVVGRWVSFGLLVGLPLLALLAAHTALLDNSFAGDVVNRMHDELWLPLKGHAYTALYPASVGIWLAVGGLALVLILGWLFFRPAVRALHEGVVVRWMAGSRGSRRVVRLAGWLRRSGRHYHLVRIIEEAWLRSVERIMLSGQWPLKPSRQRTLVLATWRLAALRRPEAGEQEADAALARVALLWRGYVLARLGGVKREDATLAMLVDPLRAALAAATSLPMLNDARGERPDWAVASVLADVGQALGMDRMAEPANNNLAHAQRRSRWTQLIARLQHRVDTLDKSPAGGAAPAIALWRVDGALTAEDQHPLMECLLCTLVLACRQAGIAKPFCDTLRQLDLARLGTYATPLVAGASGGKDLRARLSVAVPSALHRFLAGTLAETKGGQP